MCPPACLKALLVGRRPAGLEGVELELGILLVVDEGDAVECCCGSDGGEEDFSSYGCSALQTTEMYFHMSICFSFQFSCREFVLNDQWPPKRIICSSASKDTRSGS